MVNTPLTHYIQDLRKFIHKLLDCPVIKVIENYILCGPNPISFATCKDAYPSKQKSYTLKIPLSFCKFGLLIASKMKFMSLNYDHLID